MNIAIVLSGGTGTRLGADLPKQYIEIAGKPVILYCLETLLAHKGIDAIRVVAEEYWQEHIMKMIAENKDKGKLQGFSLPGVNRQMSVVNAMDDIKAFADDDTNVLVCDAARPMMSAELVTECLNAIEDHDGVLPVLPMKDTVYVSEDGKNVTKLLDRKQIWSGQAPELFRFKPYYEANHKLMPDKILNINGSTEPAVIAGMDIALISGDESNIKITTPSDMESFCRMLEKESKTDEVMGFEWNR